MIILPKHFLLLFIAALSYHTSFTQSKNDSAQAFPFVKFHYAYLLPSGDFEETYGNSSSLGGGVGYKTKSNWQFEINANYLFGGDVKRKDLLSGIINDEGDATDSDGQLVKIIYDLRGLSFSATIGKTFPVFNINENSGIIVKAGIGYIQHRIKIDYRDGDVFQLNEEMLKGYDRLHSGLLLNQFIGFQYYGRRNFTNFQLGFELNQGLTKNQREYNYDSRSFDKDQKNDLLYGFRLGWVIPIKGRTADEFYFY
ncbi:MAG: hypothetical protein RJQ00_02515 [Vicingaceae bacterium]